MTKEELQEIIGVMREWKDEIAKLTGDYKLAIADLSDVKKGFEGRWYNNGKIIALISFVILVIGLIILNYVLNWCKISISPPFDISILREGQCN